MTHTRPTRRLAALLAMALALATAGVTSLAGPAPAGAAPGTGTGAGGQTLTVSEVADLDPNGATVTVTGEGFDADAGFDVATMGLYLSVCVDQGDGQVPTPCLGGVDQSGESATTRWVTNNPIGSASVVPIAADGSFTTTLRVVSWDENTDCFALPEGQSCKVVTRVDHRGGGNRSQDVKVPVSWAAGPRLLVVPASGIDPDGQDVLVKGSGYPGAFPGIYVVYGPVPENGTDASRYGAVEFLPNTSITNGAWLVTLEDVTARYTGEDDVDYDFRTGGAHISTIRAHGFPDPNGDYAASTPIAFDRNTAAESFVTAALTDFLDAVPTDQQVSEGVAALAQQGKATWLRDLSRSDAWLTALVNRFYQDTLGRPGSASDVAWWADEIRSGRRTVAQVGASFYSSKEYYEGIGGGTATTWVDDLYEKILLRPADASGRTYWVGEVAAKGRGNVAYRMYQSQESARTRVKVLYQALLGRNADAPGIAHWAPRVLAQGDLALAVHLAASGEYATRAVARFP